jgi:hypothetical protein
MIAAITTIAAVWGVVILIYITHAKDEIIEEIRAKNKEKE